MQPYTPFMVEEIYSEGKNFKLPAGVKSAAFLAWPQYDEEKLQADEVTLVVQINGKKRAELIIPATATDKEIEAVAMENEAVKRHLEGKEIRRILHLPNKTCKVLGIVVG